MHAADAHWMEAVDTVDRQRSNAGRLLILAPAVCSSKRCGCQANSNGDGDGSGNGADRLLALATPQPTHALAKGVFPSFIPSFLYSFVARQLSEHV